jgi:hypothetical protein
MYAISLYMPVVMYSAVLCVLYVVMLLCINVVTRIETTSCCYAVMLSKMSSINPFYLQMRWTKKGTT